MGSMSAKLHNKIAAVAPIHGLFFADDGSVLSIDFNGATQAQKNAANAIAASYDKEVPEAVTKYQFKVALLRSGQLENVKTAASSLSDEAKLYWEDNAVIKRDSILIDELKVIMGLTDVQVNNFFKTAKDI